MLKYLCSVISVVTVVDWTPADMKPQTCYNKSGNADYETTYYNSGLREIFWRPNCWTLQDKNN